MSHGAWAAVSSLVITVGYVVYASAFGERLSVNQGLARAMLAVVLILGGAALMILAA